MDPDMKLGQDGYIVRDDNGTRSPTSTSRTSRGDARRRTWWRATRRGQRFFQT